MTNNQEAIAEGAARALGEWISQRDITTPECIVEGVEKAFRDFLLYNLDTEALTLAIADAVARRLVEQGVRRPNIPH
ncbi:hypothetical protein [Streptomyces subrutilus]|uniref:hypothetical protein n=1 Tax=Streptomyces subrutilus TaxID=36818 RepID=UPI002E12BB17|nr:hypothetical protein OG479_29470 [Streptomyces subrutilus]